MNIFLSAGNLDLGGWVRGLIGAGISGGSSAIVSGFVVMSTDPHDWNFAEGKFWVLLGAMFGANAIVSMAKFLQGRPLPDVKQVTTKVETTEISKKPTVTVTTVEEVHLEPK